MTRRMGLLLTLALALPADAARDKGPAEGTPEALKAALEAAGWTLTPDRAATYAVGNIYDAARNAPVVFSRDCYASLSPNEGAFTQAEVISAMKAGGKVPLGVARLRAKGMQYKQLTYAEPFVSEASVMQLERPTDDCVTYLQRKQSSEDISGWFVVQAVLSAMVNERLCRELEAGAGVVGVGELEAGLSQECVEESEGHVAVAFKTIPVADLLGGVAASAAGGGGSGSGVTVVTGVGFDGSLDVSGALAEQACQEAAQSGAARQREAKIEASSSDLRWQASSTWSSLASGAEQCLGLKDAASRAPCVAKVEQYIAWAGGLEVVVTEGFEEVETDCGARKVPLAAAARPVRVAELADAEAMLERLEGASAGGRYPMVRIEAGRFTMGSPTSEKGREDHERQHAVAISRAFWMGEAEVTQGLWREVMGSNPATKDYRGVMSLLGADLPVQNITWLDAAAFANALSRSEGLEECCRIAGEEVSWPKGLSCAGYRLPTEAEWEYAARAGGSTIWSGTNKERSACRHGNVSNPSAKKKFDWRRDVFPCEDDLLAASPVRSFQPNAWGLYDMTGNVTEWVWDWYQRDYQSDTGSDPVGVQSGSYRVRRGGDWGDYPSVARVAHRVKIAPFVRDDSLGVRLVRSVQTGSSLDP